MLLNREPDIPLKTIDIFKVRNEHAANQYSVASMMVVALLIVATILTALFAWLLTTSITQPIA